MPSVVTSPLPTLLLTPSDLSKLPALRKRLQTEHGSIQSALSSAVRDQLATTREGLRKFVEAKQALNRVEDGMREVEGLLEHETGEGGTTIAEFRKISKVSVIHRNITQTLSLVTSFRQITEKVARVSDLLAASTQAGPFEPQPYLLELHHHVTALEQFRNETLLKARKGSAADVEAVRGHFGELERVLEGFEAWLWELGGLALELCRRGREDTLVILLKICEVESQADEKAAATKLAFMALKRPSLRSVQAEARPIKHYRHRLLELLRSSIATTFDEAWSSVEGSVPDFLDQLGSWLYQDHYRIANVLVPCFPPDWQIHALYVKGYHSNLDRILHEIVRSTPEASVLLQLYGWVKEYKTSMRELSEELALPAEWTQPPLLGGKEQDLIEDYVGLIVRKMDEWTTNLLRDEAREFTVRDQPVEIDDGGQYFLQGTVIMFTMINQQVDLAADSGQAKILARTFEEANRVMKLTQARFGTLVREELKRSVERPDESPPGLVEYVMALANDQLKSADRAEELGGRCEGMVSEKLAASIAANVNDAIDGYLDVAKVCAQALIDLVFHDLKGATKLFFSPAWYSEAERPMPAVVETMRDYLLDYQAHLNPTIFELLLADILETLLVVYVSGLRKASKLRMASAVDLIRADVGQLYELFAEFRPADVLERDFEVVEMVLAILAAGKELVFLDYWTFARVHGPNVAFIEALLRARDDLDRSSVNEIMDTIKRKVRDEELADPDPPTIMARISSVKAEGLLNRLGLGFGSSSSSASSALPGFSSSSSKLLSSSSTAGA